MKVLLIPSATLISKEMQQKFGKIPSVFYPINGKTMLEHIYEKYCNRVDKTFVISHDKKELISDFISYKKLPVELIEIDEVKDIGYTIKKALQALFDTYGKAALEYLFINFADTLVSNTFPKAKENVIIYGEEHYSEDWSYFENDSSRISSILDKGNRSNKVKDPLKSYRIFVGAFGIGSPYSFYLHLATSLGTLDRTCDSLYDAFMQYSQTSDVVFQLADNWFDTGHGKKYLEAKTAVAARSFNTINIDDKRGILSKRSQNKEKFIDEIMWYIKVPNKLQYLLPRIYEYSTDWDDPYILMEYYGYNTLHELFLYGELPLYRWQTIFEKLKFIIDDMMNFKIIGYESEKKMAMEHIYINKTLKRLSVLKSNPKFSPFFTENITINGKTYFSLDRYIEMIPELLRERLINKEKIDFSVIHGDLCFSNILIEDVHGFMRLIDPRGSFGTFDIYGDVRYELAKILHSIEGLYDYIIEDMFEIKTFQTNIIYKINEKSMVLKDIFIDVFKDILLDYKDLQLIESILFLSMIPLHENSLTRQCAMLATGIQLLEKAMT